MTSSSSPSSPFSSRSSEKKTTSTSSSKKKGVSSNQDVKVNDTFRNLPRDVEEGLRKGFAHSFKALQSTLMADNVQAMRVVAASAHEAGFLVILQGELVQFYRPQITCQVCHASMEGLDLEWYQCQQCERETCMECHEMLEQVRHPNCPHCGAQFVRMPVFCSGCHLSVVKVAELKVYGGHCPNCGHRLENEEGLVAVTGDETRAKLSKSIEPVALTRSMSMRPLPMSSRQQRQQRDSRRPRDASSRSSRSQKQTVYVVTRFESQAQFIEEVVHPHLSRRIEGFHPSRHITKAELKLLKAHPVVIAWYDAFAEFFGAGRVVHRINVKNELLVMEATSEKLPLSLGEIKKFIKDAPREVIKFIPVTKSKLIPADLLSRLGVKREVLSRIRQRHRRTVRYRGANNREYKKTCELKNADIYLHDRPKIVHVPTWLFRFQVSGEPEAWYELYFTETKDGLKVITESWQNRTKFCPDCQRLVSELRRCHECRQSACTSCATSMTAWGLTKWFCSQKCQQKFAIQFETASLLGKLRYTWFSNSLIALYLVLIMLIVMGIAWLVK